jgi:hypothetical protein
MRLRLVLERHQSWSSWTTAGPGWPSRRNGTRSPPRARAFTPDEQGRDRPRSKVRSSSERTATTTCSSRGACAARARTAPITSSSDARRNVTGPYLDKPGPDMAEGRRLAGDRRRQGLESAGPQQRLHLRRQGLLVLHAYETADNYKQKLKVHGDEVGQGRLAGGRSCGPESREQVTLNAAEPALSRAIATEDGLRSAAAVAIAFARRRGAGRRCSCFRCATCAWAPSPFLDAQTHGPELPDRMEPDRLLAPFLREAGLPPKQPSYGNWESSGLDGHMGGHYLSALALMYASTGDEEVKRASTTSSRNSSARSRRTATATSAASPAAARRGARSPRASSTPTTSPSTASGCPGITCTRSTPACATPTVCRQRGRESDADRDVRLGAAPDQHLSDEQMQAMLKSEHGGMNEVLADVAQMTGQQKYMDLALKFSHQAILQPLEQEGQAHRAARQHADPEGDRLQAHRRLTGRKDMAAGRGILLADRASTTARWPSAATASRSTSTTTRTSARWSTRSKVRRPATPTIC